MPNHVTTTMQVTGDPAEVTKFRDTHIRAEDGSKGDFKIGGLEQTDMFFDFATFIPMPKVLDGIVSGSDTDMAVEAITGKTLAEVHLEHRPDDAHAKMVMGIQGKYRTPLTSEQEAEKGKRLANLTVEQLEKGMAAIRAIEETGYPTWYEWSVANWGTKWNSYDLVSLRDDPGVFVCRYDTAWSAPVPVWEAMREQYPTLRFEVDSFDEGWGFALHGVCEPGQEWDIEDVPADADSYARAYGCPPDVDRLEDDDDAPEVDPLGPPQP